MTSLGASALGWRKRDFCPLRAQGLWEGTVPFPSGCSCSSPRSLCLGRAVKYRSNLPMSARWRKTERSASVSYWKGVIFPHFLGSLVSLRLSRLEGLDFIPEIM